MLGEWPKIGMSHEPQVFSDCIVHLCVSMCLFVCVCGVTWYVWRSEANVWESVHSSYHVGPKNQTQLSRLTGH